MENKFVCDEINQKICRNFHPHSQFPECRGNCGDYYEFITIQDMRKDIASSQGRLSSFRGGIIVSPEQQKIVRALYERLQEKV